MNNLITLSGKSGTGKDTVGKMMQILIDNPNFTDMAVVSFLDRPYISQYRIKKFADKLKDMVCLLIGCTREELEDREFKETELGEEWWFFAETDKHNKIPYLENKELLEGKLPIFKLSPRTLMQLLGTEGGREIIHPNIWVNALFSDYKNLNSGPTNVIYPNWIITDVRFPNEVKAIKERGGIIIRINTNKPHTDEHVSETLLDNYEFDFVIDNNDTLLDLVVKVRELLTKLN